MRNIRFALPVFLALIAPPALADGATIAMAATTPAASPTTDALVQKLALYQRLLQPGGADYTEISAFIAANPDWPQQNLLALRREDSLMEITDPAILLHACHSIILQEAGTLARCAAAESTPTRAAKDANEAWERGFDEPTEAAAFLAQFGPQLTAHAEWRRYVRQLADNPKLAARQLTRLDPSQRQLAQVLLAFRNNDPTAADLATALPVSEQADPALFLAWSSYLLHGNNDKDALALWQRLGATAQSAEPTRLASFWNTRNRLARALLADSDASDAYALARDNGQTATDKIADAEFLAGWIALRKLGDPALAITHFTTLENCSPAVITLGRAHYWLGRAYAAQGNHQAATAEYQQAAQYPYVYYGQLAIKALGYSDTALAQMITKTHDPSVDTILANAFANTEMARAAQILVDQGNLPLARLFVQRLAATAFAPAAKVAAAYLANSLGLPDQALAIARGAAAQGVVLPDLGWPTPVTPPQLADFDPALTLAITRQESNFNSDAVSSSGALGLMQLMPGTARTVAHKMNLGPINMAALTADPSLNLQLGSDYLQDLMDRFSNVVPFTIAAYNAGPNRVDQWLQQYGNPSQANGPDMIDWIEEIPFSETRNYVQRVIENLVIYRARTGEKQAHPLAQWLN